MNLKHIISQTLLLAVTVALSACDDWTEIRPLDTGSQRPDAATEAMYEAAVREFRASDHQLVLGRFDNSVKVPSLRPQHIDVLPDSIDMVILARPDSLCERELDEMREMREAYATKYLCEVTYSYVEALWNDSQAAEEPEENVGEEPDGETSAADGENGDGEGGPTADEPQTDGFPAFCAEYVDYALGLCDKWGYDGVVVWFDGPSLDFVGEAERARLEARREAFLGSVARWREGHAAKLLLLGGSLDLLDDRTLTDGCDYLLADGRGASAMGSAAETFFRLENAGFTADRILLAVSAPDALGAGGEFGLQSALTATAEWLLEPSRTGRKGGMLIDNIQNDYFDTGLIFRNTRKAIDILNPSPNN